MLFNFEANASYTLSSLWTVDYSGIKRCNDLLKYIPWAAGNLTAENKASYEMQDVPSEHISTTTCGITSEISLSILRI